MTELEWQTQVAPMLIECWPKFDQDKQLAIWCRKLRWLTSRAVLYAIEDYYADHGRLSSPSIKAIIAIAKLKPGFRDLDRQASDGGNPELHALHKIHTKLNRVPSNWSQHEFGKFYDEWLCKEKIRQIEHWRQNGWGLRVDHFYYHSPARNCHIHVYDGSVRMPAPEGVTRDQWLARLAEYCGIEPT